MVFSRRWGRSSAACGEETIATESHMIGRNSAGRVRERPWKSDETLRLTCAVVHDDLQEVSIHEAVKILHYKGMFQASEKLKKEFARTDNRLKKDEDNRDVDKNQDTIIKVSELRGVVLPTTFSARASSRETKQQDKEKAKTAQSLFPDKDGAENVTLLLRKKPRCRLEGRRHLASSKNPSHAHRCYLKEWYSLTGELERPGVERLGRSPGFDGYNSICMVVRRGDESGLKKKRTEGRYR